MSVEIGIIALFVAIVVQRLAELRVAKRNEAWARAAGAVEHGRGHYPLFFVLHTVWLLAWPVEAWLRGAEPWTWWYVPAAAFSAAQLLRYWAIRSLGRRWNTRILVLPSQPLVATGPYRWLRHPNYVAVVIELAAAPAIFGAWWTAAVVTVLNALVLLAVRIPAEERALSSTAGRRHGDADLPD